MSEKPLICIPPLPFPLIVLLLSYEEFRVWDLFIEDLVEVGFRKNGHLVADLYEDLLLVAGEA